MPHCRAPSLYRVPGNGYRYPFHIRFSGSPASCHCRIRWCLFCQYEFVLAAARHFFLACLTRTLFFHWHCMRCMSEALGECRPRTDVWRRRLYPWWCAASGKYGLQYAHGRKTQWTHRTVVLRHILSCVFAAALLTWFSCPCRVRGHLSQEGQAFRHAQSLSFSHQDASILHAVYGQELQNWTCHMAYLCI